MALSEKAVEKGHYDALIALLKKYDIVLVEGSKTRFEHPSNLFRVYLSLYEVTFSALFSGSVVKRQQYISYYYDSISYDRLEQRIKRVLKKVDEKKVVLENKKRINQEITDKLTNYFNACHMDYEVIHPYNMGSMKVKVGNQEYYVNSNGTVKVNLAGKRFSLPLHNVSYIMGQATQFAVDQYEDVAGQYQPKKEEVA